MANNIRANASTLHRREVFYIGGQYVPDNNGEYTLQGQMYVERLLPEETPSREFPIVFIHGSTRSGTVSLLGFFLHYTYTDIYAPT